MLRLSDLKSASVVSVGATLADVEKTEELMRFFGAGLRVDKREPVGPSSHTQGTGD